MQTEKEIVPNKAEDEEIYVNLGLCYWGSTTKKEEKVDEKIIIAPTV